jgi:hypothetical protein
VDLPNDNCDVGEHTGPGKYRLNDDTHAKLLHKLADGHFTGVSSQLREELLRFFAEPDAPYATKRNAKAWAKVQIELEKLKSALPIPAAVFDPRPLAYVDHASGGGRGRDRTGDPLLGRQALYEIDPMSDGGF